MRGPIQSFASQEKQWGFYDRLIAAVKIPYTPFYLTVYPRGIFITLFRDREIRIPELIFSLLLWLAAGAWISGPCIAASFILVGKCPVDHNPPTGTLSDILSDLKICINNNRLYGSKTSKYLFPSFFPPWVKVHKYGSKLLLGDASRLGSPACQCVLYPALWNRDSMQDPRSNENSSIKLQMGPITVRPSFQAVTSVA